MGLCLLSRRALFCDRLINCSRICLRFCLGDSRSLRHQALACASTFHLPAPSTSCQAITIRVDFSSWSAALQAIDQSSCLDLLRVCWPLILVFSDCHLVSSSVSRVC